MLCVKLLKVKYSKWYTKTVIKDNIYYAAIVNIFNAWD